MPKATLALLPWPDQAQLFEGRRTHRTTAPVRVQRRSGAPLLTCFALRTVLLPLPHLYQALSTVVSGIGVASQHASPRTDHAEHLSALHGQDQRQYGRCSLPPQQSRRHGQCPSAVCEVVDQEHGPRALRECVGKRW